MIYKIKNFKQFVNESQTYIRNGYKYTNILRDGDFDYELVQSLNNKTVGIEVYFRRKIIGSINIGLLDDNLLNEYKDNEYYQLLGKNPFIYNVAIKDEFQNKGIATKLYNLLFNALKNNGYKKVYSGKTRNSIFIDNLWGKFSDGFETTNDDFGIKKYIIKIYSRMKKYRIELSEQQMKLIADCLEDVSRFASGQWKMRYILKEMLKGLPFDEEMKRRNEVEELLKQTKRVLLPDYPDNANKGYDGSEFIGNTYQIYRTILYQLAKDNDWDNVYSWPALPSGNLGTIKIEAVDV